MQKISFSLLFTFASSLAVIEGCTTIPTPTQAEINRLNGSRSILALPTPDPTLDMSQPLQDAGKKLIDAAKDLYSDLKPEKPQDFEAERPRAKLAHDPVLTIQKSPLTFRLQCLNLAENSAPIRNTHWEILERGVPILDDNIPVFVQDSAEQTSLVYTFDKPGNYTITCSLESTAQEKDSSFIYLVLY